jgi:hypothetical protein
MDIFNLPTHPAAALFPLLGEDELDELAEDIAQNGLLHPLVVQNGQLIDGRNRREACRRAKVEPKAIELNGQDPVAYIVASNVRRRHMVKGQLAMALAMLYPEPAKGGRGKKNSVDTTGFSVERLSRARTVLHFSRPLAEAVLAGTHKLDAAYDVARRGEQAGDEEQQRFAELRAAHPDLAIKVTEEDITLDEAWRQAHEREEMLRNQRATGFQSYAEAVMALSYFANADAVMRFVGAVKGHRDEFERFHKGGRVSDDAEVIKRGCAALLALIQGDDL